MEEDSAKNKEVSDKALEKPKWFTYFSRLIQRITIVIAVSFIVLIIHRFDLLGQAVSDTLIIVLVAVLYFLGIPVNLFVGADKLSYYFDLSGKTHAILGLMLLMVLNFLLIGTTVYFYREAKEKFLIKEKD